MTDDSGPEKPDIDFIEKMLPLVQQAGQLPPATRQRWEAYVNAGEALRKFGNELEKRPPDEPVTSGDLVRLITLLPEFVMAAAALHRAGPPPGS